MTARREERTPAVEQNWTDHRREQLKLWASLTLREQLEALEEMGELARRVRDAGTVHVQKPLPPRSQTG